MADEQRPEEVQRWTAKRHAALVLSLLRGETTAAEAARRHGLKVAEVEDWRERFLGYWQLWALLRFGEGIRVNRKAVYRILKLKRWFVHQRVTTPRPRVQGRRSRAQRSDERWAMDVTRVSCGADGWGHLTVVIDCHDREVNGFEFALRGRAKEAEGALEEACLARFGTLRPQGSTPVLRSDNGLIFQSRRFRAACRDYRLRQEFITPYTPEQNGLSERFFRSLKEECVWQHRLMSRAS